MLRCFTKKDNQDQNYTYCMRGKEALKYTKINQKNKLVKELRKTRLDRLKTREDKRDKINELIEKNKNKKKKATLTRIRREVLTNVAKTRLKDIKNQSKSFKEFKSN
tara:strand:+ start:1113 stop:1433 length:321 start_codon:yes stop_codon:yes gene_type:complete